jgi:hypothetical protein
VAGTDRRTRLAARRQALLQRSGELRERLALQGRALQPAFGWADQAREGWRWLQAHPWVGLVAAAVLVWRRPRAVWRGAWLVWRGWRLWQRWAPLRDRLSPLWRGAGRGPRQPTGARSS